jgi:transcriptional regulator with XRE-family HTH domain
MTEPVSPQVALGLRLRAARREAGLSQAEVSDKTGIGRVAISEIESGRRKVSSLELANLARVLAREPAFFLSDQASVRPTYTSPSNLGVLARTARKLSDHDQEQLLRFAEYLRREGKRRVEKP